MIRCIVIDDEKPAIHVLRKYISKLPQLKLVATETNPIIGVEIINTEKPDLVFLDIQMDEMTGLEMIQLISPEIHVVFCTAYSQFAVASYEYNVVDYLVKPISFTRFAKAVQRANDLIVNQVTANLHAIAHDYIFVKTGQKGKMQKIDLDDIHYIESMNNYVSFHLYSQKILAYITLKEMENYLPVALFARVHKSFIVALKYISIINSNEIILKNSQVSIPIGNIYKQAFLEKVKRNLLE